MTVEGTASAAGVVWKTLMLSLGHEPEPKWLSPMNTCSWCLIQSVLHTRSLKCMHLDSLMHNELAHSLWHEQYSKTALELNH